jgi:hypothetical protein
LGLHAAKAYRQVSAVMSSKLDYLPPPACSAAAPVNAPDHAHHFSSIASFIVQCSRGFSGRR